MRFARDVIRAEFPDVQMIILFGSYARGDWVEDEYREGHITYTYESDYDILVVTETARAANKMTDQQHVLERRIRTAVKTPISIIYHDIDRVNRMIERGRYFFVDIKREGVRLYDSKKSLLARIRKVRDQVCKQNAEEDFAIWFPKAKEFYEAFVFSVEQGFLNNAAFQLHQAAECAYATIELVFRGYKPKLHDLEKLDRRARSYEPAFGEAFPLATKKQRKLFEKLKKAYIDPRYKADYEITRAELKYLAARARKLHRLGSKHCKAKIASFVP